jgi:hypothetical protein
MSPEKYDRIEQPKLSELSNQKIVSQGEVMFRPKVENAAKIEMRPEEVKSTPPLQTISCIPSIKKWTAMAACVFSVLLRTC